MEEDEDIDPGLPPEIPPPPPESAWQASTPQAQPPPPPLPPEPDPPERVTVGSIMTATVPLFFRYAIPLVVLALVIEVGLALTIDHFGEWFARKGNLEDEIPVETLEEEDAFEDDTWEDDWEEEDVDLGAIGIGVALLLFVGAVGWAIPIVMWGAAAWLVTRHMVGKPSGRTDFGGAFTGAARALPTALAVVLVVSLPFAAGLVTPWLVFVALIAAPILYCGMFVAIPVAVVERLSPLDVLRRSWALTRGHKGPIFGILAIAMVSVGLVGAAASGELFEEDDDFWAEDEPLTAQDFRFNPLEVVLQALFDGFAATAAAVTYVLARRWRFEPDPWAETVAETFE